MDFTMAVIDAVYDAVLFGRVGCAICLCGIFAVFIAVMSIAIGVAVGVGVGCSK